MDKLAIVGIVIAVAVFGGMWYMSGRGSPEPQTDLYVSVKQPLQDTGQPAATTAQQATTTNTNKTNSKTSMQAILHTTKGNITIEFSGATPNTVTNFTKLAGEGFYNGTKFHRVIAGFMIQGGDPLTKDDSLMARWGTGGPGYQFADEITATNHNAAGTIAMANAGPNTNGSQFFINVADNAFLDTKHTVFGKVVGGMDVVTAIEHTQTGQNDRPVEPMVITSVELK